VLQCVKNLIISGLFACNALLHICGHSHSPPPDLPLRVVPDLKMLSRVSYSFDLGDTQSYLASRHDPSCMHMALVMLGGPRVNACTVLHIIKLEEEVGSWPEIQPFFHPVYDSSETCIISRFLRQTKFKINI